MARVGSAYALCTDPRRSFRPDQRSKRDQLPSVRLPTAAGSSDRHLATALATALPP